VLTFTHTAVIYINVPVSALINGIHVDPTADVVSMAWVTPDVQPTTEWAAATWMTDTSGARPTYVARRLSTGLTVGMYEVWVRVVHGVETIILPAGLIRVL
jgi:hypothetical protein